MTNVLKDKLRWLNFAHEHNDSAYTNAVQLNGSESYTLVAMHQAANMPLPKSVLLDVKRAEGKFVETHFKGLRQIYESKTPLNRWTPVILEKCRNFSMVHSLDYHELMKKILEITEEKKPRMRACNRSYLHSFAFKHSTFIEDEGDIKI